MHKLPILKAKELVRILKRMDFFEFHCVGSHAQFKHLDGRRTTIPVHSGKDIPRGTLRSVLRDIEVSPEKFLEVSKK